MSLEVYNTAVVWSRNQIGRVDRGVARLNLSMQDLVKKELKFHEICDVISHFDEIVGALVKKGYQVEAELVPDTSFGALKQSYDTWCKMYG